MNAANQYPARGRLLIRTRIAIAAGLAAAISLIAASSSLAAIEPKENVTHIFNAAHSLTGDCSVWSKDKVEDPACTEVPKGQLPPEGRLVEPSTAAVDRYGDQYVVNKQGSDEVHGVYVFHLDIFDPTGRYVGGFSVNENFPGGIGESPEISQIAVDSKGFLYISKDNRTFRYDPTTYNPEAGEIEYASQPIRIPKTKTQFIAIDPSNDHLYSSVEEAGLTEFAPPADGVPNEPLNQFPEGTAGVPIAIDASHRKLYVGGVIEVGNAFEPDIIVVRAYSLQPPYQLLATYDGSTTPGGNFGEAVHVMALAVDEASGDFFVSHQNRIEELKPDGTYVATIKEPKQEYFRTELAYDNSALSPNQGYLYFSTGVTQGRLYAYEPISLPKPPVVESVSVSGVSEDEAILRARVNPSGEAGGYVFEYTTQADFDENAFAGAQVAGEGAIEKTGEGVAVFAAAHGLGAGTAYRYRVRAENQCEPGGCEVESQGSFKTFGPYAQSGDCANQALRSGDSAQLPDCRAYELVTPANTGGRAPFAPGGSFGTWNASPGGSSLAFEGNGGAYPGQDTPGGTNGDLYVSRRGASGWSSEAVGLAGRQSSSQSPLGLSPDHSLSVVQSFPAGEVEAELPSRLIDYIRYQNGSVRQAGEGSIGTVDNVGICGISMEGEHVVFLAGGKVVGGLGGLPQLEPEAAPAGTSSIYDRTGRETLQVVSLLPGEVTPAAGEDAECKGVSADGSAVAFEVNGVTYLRLGNVETLDPLPQARTGHPLSCDPGNQLADAEPAYEWLRDGTPIPGADAGTYTPALADSGTELQCIVRLVGSEGGSIAAGPPLVVDEGRAAGPPPRPQGPSLPPRASLSEALDCQPGVWSAGPTISYQWYRDGVPIAGAESSGYEAKAADDHSLLQCAVTGEANGASVVAISGVSEVNPPPRPSGSSTVVNVSNPGKAPIPGDQLECKAGAWQNAPAFSYQWLRNGTPIAAATNATYSVAAPDAGTSLQCLVAGVNPGGTEDAVSAAIAIPPTAASQLPAGSLTVEGLPVVGKTLECKAGTWQNAPAFSYQWLRNATPIAAATSSTYTLGAGDREKVVQCELTAANPSGTVVALAGAFVPQAPVAAASTPAVPTTFAGLSQDGRYLFYLSGGDLFRYDSESETAVPFAASGDAAPAYVSADGSTAYFTSKSVLTPEANPDGEIAVAGQDNLYQAREGEVRFVATVTEVDVKGEFVPSKNKFVDGFSDWLKGPGAAGLQPMRTSADGSVSLFVSRADLTDFKSSGKRQVYRYDSNEGTLICISCSPTGEAPSSGATLLTPLSLPGQTGNSAPARDPSIVPNLSTDGRRAFFESDERLVPADEDGHKDVYEWEARGKGSCDEPGGCLFLISSGQSTRDDYLYGASESGDDVFVYTSDLLNAEDSEEAPSVYDAKVEGGFPPRQANAGECLGEACQPAAVAPDDATPASSSFEGSGNVKAEGKAKHRKKKHKKHKKHKRAKAKRRAHR